MTWFVFSVITLLCWSGSDFFSKLGCRDASDRFSQFKMVMAVGLIMGLHAAYEIFLNGVFISIDVVVTYLPVSLLYIASMTLGYVGLRYIELSISSPICNASGALVAIAAILTGKAEGMVAPQYLAIALACAGVIGLGFVESREDEQLREARQDASNYKYAKSWLALALPIAYCLLDAAGTFCDDVVLQALQLDFVKANIPHEYLELFGGGIPTALVEFTEEFNNPEVYPSLFANGIPETLQGLASSNGISKEGMLGLATLTSQMSEASASSANVAYELTFFAAGVACFVYTVVIRKQRLTRKAECPKYLGAIFETAGQFTYIMALASGNAALACPVISSYCMVSVLWSRLFLKERLSWKHYVCIGVTFAGILIMGIYDM